MTASSTSLFTAPSAPSTPSVPRSLRRASLLVAPTMLLLAIVALAAVPAQAQGYHLGVLGGVGGAIDGDPFDHAALEAQFGYQRGLRDLVMVRVGQLDFDASDDVFAVDGELTWLTLTSEYRLPEDFYVSGIFLGLGYYQLRNDFGLGDDEGIGVTFGVNGEFPITDHWGLLVQLTGHWADLEGEQYWTTAMGGITFSF